MKKIISTLNTSQSTRVDNSEASFDILYKNFTVYVFLKTGGNLKAADQINIRRIHKYLHSVLTQDALSFNHLEHDEPGCN